jgi:hypothetical protein
LKLSSHPYPDYLYDLVQHHDQAIPRDPSYRPGPNDLARIDQSFRDTKQGEALDLRHDLSPDFTWAVGAAVTPVAAQGTYTAWVTASPSIKWLSQAAVPDLSEMGSARSYKPRSTTKETWFAPVQRPRLLSDSRFSDAPSRVGDILGVYGMPAWGDSGRHMGTVWSGVTVNTTLYQGENLIGQGDQFVFADVAPEPLPYRLVVDTARDLPDRPYSPRTHTEWVFISDQADYAALEPLPLIQLDYAVSTDLSGRAHRRTGLMVTPSHLPGAAGPGPISTVTLELSYDDGASWHTAKLRRSRNDWLGQLDAPSQAKYATLRTTARDTKGNAVTQTVVRAFGLE